MGLPTPAELTGLVTILAPGLVILGVREWFVAAPKAKLEERAVTYAAVSSVYYAAASLVAGALKDRVDLPQWVASGLEYLILPAAIGLLLGIATINDWMEGFWDWLRIQPVHHAPTAWDYGFTRMKRPPFVLVRLNDGSIVGGHYRRGSFASSSSGERDLLLKELWEVQEGTWTLKEPRRSILLCGRDIKSIEFFNEDDHDQAHDTPNLSSGAEGLPSAEGRQ